MEFLAALWLPIVLSAVLVFVVSSVIHMLLGYHKGEYQKLAGEDEILETMRKFTNERGEYAFPCPPSMKEVSSPEMVKKFEQGPCGYITMIPNGAPAMGKSLVLWFLYSILISVFAGYVTMHGLEAGAPYLSVFRLSGTVAIVGYAATHVPGSIWMGRPWGTTFKHIFDGIIYGLLTAGVFGWLWPGM